jgi:hypothetical protein
MNKHKSANKHLTHKIDVTTTPIPTKLSWLTHPGKVVCIECNKHLQWISDYDIKRYKEYKNLVKTYEDFVKITTKPIPKPVPDKVIYLAIGYTQKHIAIQNKCRYDPIEKLWYTSVDNPNNKYLYDYMMPDDLRYAKNYRVIHFIE